MRSEYTSYFKPEHLVGIISLVVALMLGVWLTEYTIKEFILIVIGILGIGICILRPKIPMFLFFMFIPMESVTLLPSQTLTKFAGLYLAGLFFLQIAVIKRVLIPFSLKTLCILIFGVVAVLSLVGSGDIARIDKIFSLWMYIFMYFVFYSMLGNISTFEKVIFCLVIGGFLSVLFNFAGVMGDVRYVSRLGDTRRAGLTGGVNFFASMLLFLIPFSLLMFFRYKNIFMKVLTLGLFACILIGFFNTFSRGGFIGLAALLMFSIFKFNLLQGSNKVKIVGYAMLVAIVGAIVFASVSETYMARIETLTTVGAADAADSSLEDRVENIKYAIKVFIDHPILGVGARNFVLFNPLDKVAHNMYLEVLTGTGLIGFIPFMAILFLSWRDLKKVQNSCKLTGRENSLLYQTAVAFELGFVGYLVTALFLSIDLEKMTWLLITLSSVLWKISLNEKGMVSYDEKSYTYPPGYTTLGRG